MSSIGARQIRNQPPQHTNRLPPPIQPPRKLVEIRFCVGGVVVGSVQRELIIEPRSAQTTTRQ